jgi:carboxypeptidase family protein
MRVAIADMDDHRRLLRSARVGIACAAVLLGAAVAAGEPPGTVTGTIRLTGPPPARPAMPVFKHAEVCGAAVPDDRLVVAPEGGVRHAVVTIDGVPGGRKVEPDAVPTLNNLACRFEPHVQVAEVGQTLELRNGDPILHNADARLGAETLFNVALPPARVVRKTLSRPGLIAITCDVRHTWMSAFVVVAEHPYHTVTDAEGVYEIRGIPPGRYTLEVWHETLGTLERPVTVEPASTVVMDAAYPAEAGESHAAR